MCCKHKHVISTVEFYTWSWLLHAQPRRRYTPECSEHFPVVVNASDPDYLRPHSSYVKNQLWKKGPDPIPWTVQEFVSAVSCTEKKRWRILTDPAMSQCFLATNLATLTGRSHSSKVFTIVYTQVKNIHRSTLYRLWIQCLIKGHGCERVVGIVC